MLKKILLISLICTACSRQDLQTDRLIIETQSMESIDANLETSIKNHKIGFIGESHSSGFFGNELMKQLSKIGDVRRLAIGGSSSQYWTRADEYEFKWGFIYDEWKQRQEYSQLLDKGSKFLLSRQVTQDFFDEGRFDIIVIQLMDNQLFNSIDANQKSIRQLLQIIQEANVIKAKCFFVSATHKDIPGSYASITNQKKKYFIDNVLAPLLKTMSCHLVDSMTLLSLKSVKTTDGLHLDEVSGRYWGKVVSDFIKVNAQ